MFTKKRYISILPLKIKCEKLNTELIFDYVFSGVYQQISSEIVSLTDINPGKTLDILSPNQKIYIYINFKEGNYIVKGFIKNVEKEKVILKIDQNNINPDKRQFYRFHFCCKDLGNFILSHNSKTVSKEVCIYEISRTGIGLYLPPEVYLKTGDRYELADEQNNVKFNLEVIHFKKGDKFNTVGCRITNVNINLLKYILKEYIKVSERIVCEG